MKRIMLFLATNLAVMLVMSLVLNIIYMVTGVQVRAEEFTSILVMAALFGFGGSFISLMMSKKMALRSVGGQIIETPRNDTEYWLIKVVSQQAKEAGVEMPDVAIYDSPDINAFATGAKRNNSLIAVSTGLLHNMTEEEAEAVLAHEMSHISNGDMVTMTLMQGVINTFVIFFARIIASMITSRNNSNNGRGNSMAYYTVASFMEMAFGFLASFITMWYSRKREFHADAGAAKLVGRHKMIAALERLKTGHEPQLTSSMKAFGISGKRSSMAELLMTHPPLEKRIEALRNMSDDYDSWMMK